MTKISNGLSTLFDSDDIVKEKYDKLSYNDGKKRCCKEVCETINAYIDDEKMRRDEAKVEIHEYEGMKKILAREDVVSSANDRLDLLKELKNDIVKHEPYCKCK